jgi:hypothetical protein
MRIFLSHSSADQWVARQITVHVVAAGGACFLDTDDIPRQDNFLDRIVEAVTDCDELLVLLTPSSIERFWITFEMSCFRFARKPIVGVLNGLSPAEARRHACIEALLDNRTLLDINQLDTYFDELRQRIGASNANQTNG